MSRTNFLLLICCLFFYIVPNSIAQNSFRPKALVLPVTKDSATLQYTTQIHQRAPLVPVKLTIDVGAEHLWVNCDQGFTSSSSKQVRCNSAQCSLVKPKTCTACVNNPLSTGCSNSTCVLSPDNRVTRSGTSGDVLTDVITIQSTDGSNPGRIVSVPNFIFVCGSNFVQNGLAKGVTGIAGLGRSKISLFNQLSATFSLGRKFAICLSSSTVSNGVVFIGDGPYNFLPSIDVSKSLVYTPLILNPVSTAVGYFAGQTSDDYFIGIKSININGKNVPLNTSLLSIDSNGNGGTKISTVDKYSVLETSIYKAVTDAFVKELSSVPRVTSVAPFSVCYQSSKLGWTRIGPSVPQIDLVLHSSSVVWSIYGQNSMVQVNNDVSCLGFVDGGDNPRTSIVIGGRQLEDNLVQIDLATSRLGFSSSLLFSRTNCANFNFTSTAN